LNTYAGVSEFLVTPLLIGPVCLLSPGQFEEPVRSSLENTVGLCVHGVTVELPNGGGMKAFPGHRFLTDE